MRRGFYELHQQTGGGNRTRASGTGIRRSNHCEAILSYGTHDIFKRWSATDARSLLGKPNVGYQKSRFCTFSGLSNEVTPRYGNHHPVSLFQRSLYLSGCKATTPLRIVFAYLKKVLENIQISQKKHHFHSILTHGTLFVENRIAQTKAL